MGATVAEIREGLRIVLAAAFEPEASVSAYMRDTPGPRQLQVMGTDAVEYDLAMQRGLDRWTMIVQAFAGSPAEKPAQERLDAWLAPNGAGSVKAAIEADITLGGKVQSARVARSAGYRIYDVPNRGKMLGTEFFVDIFNKGN